MDNKTLRNISLNKDVIIDAIANRVSHLCVSVEHAHMLAHEVYHEIYYKMKYRKIPKE